MKKIILLFLIGSLLFCCGSNKKRSIPSITFSDSAFITIIAENEFDSFLISTTYSSWFPIQPCLIHQIKIKKSGIYKISYKITRPEIVKIKISNVDTFITYMRPSDTVVIRIGANKEGTNNKSLFYELDDPIYRYFQAEKKEFGYHYYESPLTFQAFNIAPESQKDFDHIVSRINSAQNDRLAFLENCRIELPEWFASIEKYNILYYSAGLKLYQYFYLHNHNLGGELMPVDIDINNPEAVTSPFYWNFISDYFSLSDTLNNYLQGPARDLALYNKYSPKLNTILKDYNLRYYHAYHLISLIKAIESYGDIEIVNKFIESNDFGLKESEIAYINEELNNRRKYVEQKEKLILTAGTKAPSFHLNDLPGNLHTLDEFNGEIVYLHFWATWCGPCLKEMPSINLLYEKIGSKPITIINICTDSEPKKWKEIIEKEKLSGLNLICQGNWAKALQESYIIRALPHYVLIDKNGKIILNGCKRPNEIYDDLTSLLSIE